MRVRNLIRYQELSVMKDRLVKRAVNDYSDIKYLIDQLISGSNEAWSYFLKHYSGLIYNRILSFFDLKDDRSDFFQEFLKILIEDNYAKLRKIRIFDERVFCSFLGIVTTRSALNYKRRMKKHYPLPDEILGLCLYRSDPPDAEIFRREITEIINERLHDQERLVMLYFLEGITLDQISKLMGLKLSQVFQIKKKAVSKIKSFLKED